jgi:hypothetical protein
MIQRMVQDQAHSVKCPPLQTVQVQWTVVKVVLGSCVENNCQEPVTYGGPIVNFRWDQMTKMEFKWLSVREIVPPTATKTAYAYAGHRDTDTVRAGYSHGLASYYERGYNLRQYPWEEEARIPVQSRL